MRPTPQVHLSLLILLLLGTAAACAPSTDSEQQTDRASDTGMAEQAEPQQASRPGVSASEMIEQALNPQHDEPRHPFLNDLQPPTRLEKEAVQNRHVQGQIDTIRTYHYDGLRLRVYDPSVGSDRMVTDIRIDSTGYDHPLGFDVGAPESSVREELGDPEEVRDRDLRYTVGRTAEDPAAAPTYLDIRVADGRVTRLVWRFYYD